MVSLFIVISWMLLLLSGFDDSVPPTGDKTFKIETRPDIVESIEIISDERMPLWGFDIELKQYFKDYLEIMIPKNLPTPASFTSKWYHDEVPFGTPSLSFAKSSDFGQTFEKKRLFVGARPDIKYYGDTLYLTFVGMDWEILYSKSSNESRIQVR